ncbi:hypothetical protein D9M69_605820 [compost metagenome]
MNNSRCNRDEVTCTNQDGVTCHAAKALALYDGAKSPFFMPMGDPLLPMLMMPHLLQIEQAQSPNFGSIQHHNGRLPVMRFTQRFGPANPIPSISSSACAD